MAAGPRRDLVAANEAVAGRGDVAVNAKTASAASTQLQQAVPKIVTT